MSAAPIVLTLIANALLIGLVAAAIDTPLAWIAVGVPLGTAIQIVVFEIQQGRRHV